VIGGTNSAARNVISGNNGPGISIGSLAATIQGNFIGLNAAGSAALGNTANGIINSGGITTIGGTANLSQQTVDFPAIRPVLEALEEQVVLLRLLDQSVSSSKVLVRIGNETQHEGLVGASVVSTGYGLHGAAVGAVGVLGPRRMDYAHTMARVAAVARYVGTLLEDR